MTNPKKLRQQRTHPLWWCFAAICAILIITVIIAGVIVFVGYIVIRPRVPIISVTNAHLDQFQYEQAGILVTQVNIIVRSENDNTKAHASFSDLKLTLIFDGIEIAHLVAPSYEVTKNNSVDFNYVATSNPIPLNPEQMQDLDVLLKEDQVRFDLIGSARARWKVGLLGSVRFWCHLNCHLHFFQSNGSYIPSRCTSKSK